MRTNILILCGLFLSTNNSNAALVVDNFSEESQFVQMTMLVSSIGQNSSTSNASTSIMPVSGSRNQRATSVYYYSVSAPFNMWTSVAQARRATCLIDSARGEAVLSMNGKLTTGAVQMDYLAQVGSAMDLAAYGHSLLIAGTLVSGPTLNQAMYGSGVSVFVEVKDTMGNVARRSVVNQTGSELSGDLSFEFSRFGPVNMSAVERLTVGFEYGGNPFFDAELIYFPPEYRLNAISIVPTPAALSLLALSGLCTRRRK
jgi:hypothetical protein